MTEQKMNKWLKRYCWIQIGWVIITTTLSILIYFSEQNWSYAIAQILILALPEATLIYLAIKYLRTK